MPHYTSETYRATNETTRTIMTQQSADAHALRRLDAQLLDYLDIRRGDRITFETIAAEIETVSEKCYRHGNTGQKVERTISRTETVLDSETLKLWRTKARGFYWMSV